MFDLFSVEVLGLRDPGPELVIQVRCSQCSLIIKRTKFDARTVILAEVEPLGDADAQVVAEHLRIFHGIDTAIN